MKIGILTLPPIINIGGILQTFALQTILEQHGHVVTIICPEELLRIKLRKTVKVCYNRICKKNMPSIDEYTKPFVNQYLHIKKYRSLESIKSDEYDIIVVGSDQIWRPSFFRYQFHTKKTENVFLDFTKTWNIKRIAYAVSFGVDKWEYDKRTTSICQNLIMSFSGVSVREMSGKILCEQYLNYSNVELVLDPTFLLSSDVYIGLFKGEKRKSTPYISSYILDITPQKQQIIKDIAITKNLNVQTISASEFSLQPSVSDWLQSIYESQFLITDSFHACVFAIIFNKAFVVLENEKRGMTRIFSLLSMFGVTNRYIKDKQIIPDELFETLPNIDYETLKKKSLSFLMRNIKNE